MELNDFERPLVSPTLNIFKNCFWECVGDIKVVSLGDDFEQPKAVSFGTHHHKTSYIIMQPWKHVFTQNVKI